MGRRVVLWGFRVHDCILSFFLRTMRPVFQLLLFSSTLHLWYQIGLHNVIFLYDIRKISLCVYTTEQQPGRVSVGTALGSHAGGSIRIVLFSQTHVCIGKVLSSQT